jgi:hypothetical protein
MTDTLWDVTTQWEQSLLAIGCEAVAKVVNAPAQESRADFIAGKVDRHPGRSHKFAYFAKTK